MEIKPGFRNTSDTVMCVYASTQADPAHKASIFRVNVQCWGQEHFDEILTNVEQMCSNKWLNIS